MTHLPFLRGFLRTLVGMRDSSRGYAMRAYRAELHRLDPHVPQVELDAAVTELAR